MGCSQPESSWQNEGPPRRRPWGTQRWPGCHALCESEERRLFSPGSPTLLASVSPTSVSRGTGCHQGKVQVRQDGAGGRLAGGGSGQSVREGVCSQRRGPDPRASGRTPRSPVGRVGQGRREGTIWSHTAHAHVCTCRRTHSTHMCTQTYTAHVCTCRCTQARTAHACTHRCTCHTHSTHVCTQPHRHTLCTHVRSVSHHFTLFSVRDSATGAGRAHDLGPAPALRATTLRGRFS